jgi:hypothetical protein
VQGNITHRAIAVAFWLITAYGCAGELEDPKRFDAVLARFGDAGASGQGGRAGASGASGASGSAGSGGSMMMSDSGMPSGDAPPACVGQVFMRGCGLTGCHDKTSTVIDLVSPGVQTRLLDKVSTSTICKGRKLIDSSGGASLLIDKLAAAPPCGSKMPAIGTLSSADRTCLEDWVSDLGGGS